MITVIAGIGVILAVALFVRIADIAQTTTRRRVAIERRESWEARTAGLTDRSPALPANRS